MDAQTAPSDGGVGAGKWASGAATSSSPTDPQVGSPGQATTGGTWGMTMKGIEARAVAAETALDQERGLHRSKSSSRVGTLLSTWRRWCVQAHY